MEKKIIKDISRATNELKAMLLHHRLVPGVLIECETSVSRYGSIVIRSSGERMMLRASEFAQIEFEEVG